MDGPVICKKSYYRHSYYRQSVWWIPGRLQVFHHLCDNSSISNSDPDHTRYIVTAAHCVFLDEGWGNTKPAPPSDVTVTLGEHDR